MEEVTKKSGAEGVFEARGDCFITVRSEERARGVFGEIVLRC